MMMKTIFGLVGLIGVVLWVTGNLAIPTEKASENLNGLLPKQMQQPEELFYGDSPETAATVVGTEDPQGDSRVRTDVLSIQDGDTITVGYPSEDDRVRIRLVGIDTPELAQPGGNEAKTYLSGSIGSQVFIEPVDRDQYGRILAIVWATAEADASVNYQLVLAGMAYRYMSDDPHLAEAEQEAQRAERGVWADPDAIRPWDWRNRAFAGP